MSTSVAFKQKSLFRLVPGLFSQRRLFNPATPFDNASVAQQTLTSILDSLGGILWLPNQHNYTLSSDTAVAPVGDPVGYMGSHRQNLPENYIKNSMMVGASAGVMPDLWTSLTTTANGVTMTLLGKGTDSDGDYSEYSLTGTDAGGSGNHQLNPNGGSATGNHPTVSNSQMWTGQVKIKGISGTQRALSLRLRMLDSGNNTLGADFTTNITPVNGVCSNYVCTGVLNNASVTQLRYMLQWTVAAGSGTWDNVFRIYAPQLERGKPTAFTPTYGTAITRGTNFEPAWQDTTAAKPILGVDADGKGTLVYDGSNDFFRTGIQTPEAGYIAGVWASNISGSTRSMFSSMNGTFVGMRLYKLTTDLVQLHRHDGVLPSERATGTLAMAPAKTVVDGHFATASASVRTNGQNEGTNAASLVVTSTNYFRIGADCNTNGGDTQSNYWSGSMLAQIWIPGARPGETAEAEIRRLLAEITAVSGVV